jgi:hypothetical protein
MSGARPAPGGTPVFARVVVGVDRHEGGRDALALAGLLQEACGGISSRSTSIRSTAV